MSFLGGLIDLWIFCFSSCDLTFLKLSFLVSVMEELIKPSFPSKLLNAKAPHLCQKEVHAPEHGQVTPATLSSHLCAHAFRGLKTWPAIQDLSWAFLLAYFCSYCPSSPVQTYLWEVFLIPLGKVSHQFILLINRAMCLLYCHVVACITAVGALS